MELHPLTPYLEADDAVVEARWAHLIAWLRTRFGYEPGIEGILFLVGVQAHGRGYEPDLEKDAKQNLVMEGTYCVFEALGIYERVGIEADGYWIWERRIQAPPGLPVEAQEKLLRVAILAYFDSLADTSDAARP